MQRHLRKFAPVFAICAIAGTIAAPAALAQGSAVDQYSEGIPSAKGERPSSEAFAGGTPGAGTGAGAGEAGRAEALARATEPGQSTSDNTQSPDTSGLGVLLPLILIASAAAAIALLVARRRQTAS